MVNKKVAYKLIGEIIGEWKIVEFLSAGGSGDIYKAVSKFDKTLVALKIFNERIKNTSDTDEFRKRFYREVDSMIALNHQHIAKIYDYNFYNEKAYIASELIIGETLYDYVKKHGKLSGQEVVDIFTKLSNALMQIHKKQIFHRDIKPSNIMIDKNGEPFIIDFSISQTFSDERITKTGAVMGTLGYCSPEVLSGNQPTKQSDFWGLCASLAFCILGSDPFGSKPQKAVLSNIHSGNIIAENFSNDKVLDVLKLALNPDEQERIDFETCLDLLDEMSIGNTWKKSDMDLTARIIKPKNSTKQLTQKTEKTQLRDTITMKNNSTVSQNKKTTKGQNKTTPPTQKSTIHKDPFFVFVFMLFYASLSTIFPVVFVALAILFFIIMSGIYSTIKEGFSIFGFIKPILTVIPTLILSSFSTVIILLLGSFLQIHTQLFNQDIFDKIFAFFYTQNETHSVQIAILFFALIIPSFMIFYGFGSHPVRRGTQYVFQKIVPWPYTIILDIVFIILTYLALYLSFNTYMDMNFWPLHFRLDMLVGI